MNRLILILFLSLSKMVSAVEVDTIINLRKTGPEIKPKSEEESYQYHIALSVDVFNFLSSKAYVSAEIPLSKLNSIVLAYGNYILGGINVTNTSNKVISKYDREQIFGLGIRHHFKDITTKDKSPLYIQTQFLTGKALLNDIYGKTYTVTPYKSGAINVGYCSILHKGLFYGVDAGIGVEKVNMTYFWYRIGFEAGFAF